MKNVLIVGGGLAGISTAYHLNKIPYVLIEREKELGGTARSFKIKKFTFDFTGHLLHLHTPYTKKLITKLLKGNFFHCVRNTKIFSHGTYTNYPFQANTYGLPDKVAEECILGLLDIHLKENDSKQENPNFKEWCLNKFGVGISDHFMIPYNEKLYQTDAKDMTADWTGRFVPTPLLEDVIRGSLYSKNIGFGYNQKFLYPKRGGIQVLAEKLGQDLKNIFLETSLYSLNIKEKLAITSNGEKIKYSNLVNTIPLPEFLKRIEDLPKPIKHAMRQLRYASVLCLNLGVNRARISNTSWIYFPEKKFPFYRVGFPMNFTPHAVPRGCSSMYVEIPIKFKEKYSKKKILKGVRRGLLDARILKPSDKFKAIQFLPIKYGYVVFNKERQRALNKIFAFLKKNKIQSTGRYGAWKYSFMEEAILDGKKAAENIR